MEEEIKTPAQEKEEITEYTVSISITNIHAEIIKELLEQEENRLSKEINILKNSKILKHDPQWWIEKREEKLKRAEIRKRRVGIARLFIEMQTLEDGCLKVELKNK